MNKPVKPLGGKAYGHIPHLPNSRMGPADHSCHEGQWRICCEKARDRHDRIIVTEKLDGSCCTVARVDGELLAIARSGYPASTSPFTHLHEFDHWVKSNQHRFDALPNGYRIAGEWLAMAHGTIYSVHYEPFVMFDLIGPNGRERHDKARELFGATGLEAAYVVHDGGPISVELAIEKLGPFGRHGATEKIEGAVWRVERKGEFDFLAKWVDPKKVDGKYLETVTGEAPIWLTRPTTGETNE